jgi:hypothetical protein
MLVETVNDTGMITEIRIHRMCVVPHFVGRFMEVLIHSSRKMLRKVMEEEQ